MHKITNLWTKFLALAKSKSGGGFIFIACLFVFLALWAVIRLNKIQEISLIDNVIISAILVVILSIWIWQSLCLINDYRKIKTQIESFKKAIEGISNIETFTQKVEIIKQEVDKIDHFKPIWYEFMETLIPIKDKNKLIGYKNTAQAELYINKDTIIYQQAPVDVFEAIPGILTGLGLVGTFTAITIALMGFDVTTAETLQTSVENLLSGLSIKFLSSLAGILCAIVFIAFKKNLLVELEKKLYGIQIKLNKIFPRRTAESFLNDILHEIKEQTADLKGFLTDMDFSNTIKKAFDTSTSSIVPAIREVKDIMEHSNEVATRNKEEVIEKINQQIKETINSQTENIINSNEKTLETLNLNINNGLTDIKNTVNIVYFDNLKSQLEQLQDSITNRLASTINDVLSDSMNQIINSFSSVVIEIKEAVSELKNLKQESSASLIEKLIQELNASMERMQKEISNAILGSAGGAIDDLAKNLSEASSCLSGIENTFETFMYKMQEQMGSYSKERDDAIQIVIKEVLEKLSGFMEDLNFKISNLVGQLNEFDSQRNNELENNLNKITEKISLVLEQVGNSNNQVAGKTSEVINDLDNCVKNIHSGVNNSLEHNLSFISEKVSGILNDINNQTQQINEANRQAIESITSNFVGVNNLVKSTLEDQNLKLNIWTDKIKEYLDRNIDNQLEAEEIFKQVVNGLYQALEKQKNVVSENTKLADSIGVSARELGDSSSKLYAASGSIEKSLETSKETQNVSKQLFDNFNQVNEELKKKIKENIDLWQKERDTFKEIESSVDKLISSLGETIEKYTTGTKHAQDKFLQDFVLQTTNIINSLNTVVTEQKEVLDEITDSIGEIKVRS